MKLKTERITPQKAKAYLEKNNRNRPISQKMVQTYASAMRRGEWELNGETIKFHVDGDLLDGQHRLLAVIQSGCSIESGVAVEVNGDAWNTVDQGHHRTLAQMLARDGEKHATHLATAVRYFRMFCPDLVAYPLAGIKYKLSIKQGLSVLSDTPELRAGVQQMIEWRADRVYSCGILAGAYVACLKLAGDWSYDFWESVVAGTNLSEGTPQYRLRNRFLENKVATEKMNRSTAVVLIVKAWNHYMDGTVMDSCRIKNSDLEARLHGCSD